MVDKRQPPSLRLYQANVDRGEAAHHAALQLAYEEDFNIVLLQEPYTSYNQRKDVCRTPDHPGFYCFSPVSYWNSWDTRPRVLTYVRTHKTLQPEQLSYARSRDLLWLDVNGVTILNVYNRPEEPAILQAVTAWNPPENTIVAGDMNASHPLWRTDRATTPGGTQLAEWVEKHSLQLLNEPDVDTTVAKGRGRPNTIDLAFSNVTTATATVEEHLTTGSLHYTISIEALAAQPAPKVVGRFKITTDEELQRFSTHVKTVADTLCGELNSRCDIEAATQQLSAAIENAIKTCGHRQMGHKARASPWWNEECSDALTDLRVMWMATESATGEDTQRARVEFKRTVRRVKRDFWRRIITDITSPEDVYRVTRWLKPRQRLAPPPIQIGDEVYSTNIDKARALGQCKLARRDATDDIDNPWRPLEEQPGPIPFEQHISVAEAKHGLLSTGNTSPGADGITVKMLQAIWPSIGRRVTEIYNACLRHGYYPQAFKKAEVVMIPKPNKRNLSDISAWRPISLLSCLGKGLERIIAKRMAYLAIKHKVVHHNQAGALPQRSATDIVAALVHDVEMAFRHQKVATLVTMDVEGAFDAILRNRLLLQLRKQGWPDFLVRWIASFLAQRQASVRFQNAIAEPIELACGTPQGSPLSPILYLLATAAIYYLSGPTQRYGYADDTAMLFVGDTLEETTLLANEAIANMETWGRAEGFSFDVKKTEVMHFTRKRKKPNPAITHQNSSIQAGGAMRWLGVWLDRQLSFTTHIDRWILKAKGIIYHLRSMNNTVRGISAAAARRAAWTVVMPTLFYGADVWYPGAEKLPKGALTKIQKVLTQACRMILPSWKTYPKATLWREAGIPPADLLLQQISERTANRWARLDVQHPITRRLTGDEHQIQHENRPEAARTVITAKIRLFRTASKAMQQERPRLIPDRYSTAIPTESAQDRPSKEEGAKRFQTWLDSRPTGLIVFSDGSKTEQDTAGYGFAVFRDGRLLDSGNGQLGKREVFDAEITGALQGLKSAIAQRQPHERITICIDNTSVIDGIGATAPISSQADFRTLQKTGDLSPGLISVRWCPGHVGIYGNDLADQLAKEGAKLPVPDLLPSVSYCKRRTKAVLATTFQTWWERIDRPSYKKLRLRAELKKLPELSLQRRQLGYLLAARTHHGDFAEYHERFNHEDAETHCPCGRQKSPTHLFYCRKIPRSLRPRLAPDPEAAIGKYLSSSFQTLVKLADFYYQKINKQN